jgi:hypothetical protein
MRAPRVVRAAVGALEDTKEVTLMLFGAHAFIWAGEWTSERAGKGIGGTAEARLAC